MGRKQRGKKVSTGLGKALVNKKKKRAQNRTKPQRYAGVTYYTMPQKSRLFKCVFNVNEAAFDGVWILW